MPYWSVTVGKLLRQHDDFDVVHSHLDYFGFSLARQASVPVLTTLYGRLDLPELQPVFREFSDVPLVSISDAQRGPVPSANFVATIHHGVDLNEFTFNPRPGSRPACRASARLEAIRLITPDASGTGRSVFHMREGSPPYFVTLEPYDYWSSILTANQPRRTVEVVAVPDGPRQVAVRVGRSLRFRRPPAPVAAAAAQTRLRSHDFVRGVRRWGYALTAFPPGRASC